MFSTKKRQTQQDVYELLRRVVNATDPTLTPVREDQRAEIRQSRVFPVLLTPWEHSGPVTADSVYALTKDVSDHGIALVLDAPFRADAVVIGFAVPSLSSENPELQSHFVLGSVRQNERMGGGYWQLGVELSKQVFIEQHADLHDLVLPVKLVSRVTCANLLRKSNMQ